VQTLKYLTHDAQACRVTLVLSDASAVLGLDPDPDRRKFIWLGDFSRAEADARLDAAKLLVGEGKLREEVFDVTTRPAALQDLCSSLSAAKRDPSDLKVVRSFAEAKREQAGTRVTLLLKCDDSKANTDQGLHFRHILRDMLDNGGSLPLARAPYMAPPKVAAPHFKEYDAIRFRRFRSIRVGERV
jgi:hypothetical protein